MAISEDRISQKKPVLGAESYQQKADADNAQNPVQNGDMLGANKLMYQIVQNCVDYAKQQFNGSLKYDASVLSDLLFANIKKIIAEGLNEDKFVKEAADALLDKGAVADAQTNQPVSEVEAPDYDKLAASVDAALQLLKARKLGLEKLEEDATEAAKTSASLQDSDDATRGRWIDSLLNRLRGNQESIQKHIQQQEKSKQQVGTKLESLVSMAKKANAKSEKGAFGAKTSRFLVVPILNGKPDTSKARLVETDQPEDPDFLARASTASGGLTGMAQKMKAAKKAGESSQNPGSIVVSTQKKVATINGRISGFTTSVKKTAATTLKMAAKGFWKMSKITGKAFQIAGKFVLAVGKAIYDAGKRVVNAANDLAKSLPGKTKILAPILAPLAIFHGSGSGAAIVTKFGWKMTKWVGRKLWSGIKQLAFKVGNFFKSLFEVGKKFKNTQAFYSDRLGKDVKDKKYMFLIKPIAQMMVTAFGFAMSVAHGMGGFIAQTVPSLLERTHNALHNIRASARNLYEKSWPMFKRILFNPVTLAVLVGGIAFLFGRTLMGWLIGMVDGIKGGILPFVMGFGRKVMGFLSAAWSIITTVGKVLFDVVEWLTRPQGMVMKAIFGFIKMVLWIKDSISFLIEKSGKSKIDVLCMWLAGDNIGLAIHAIAGLVKTIWGWLKKQKIMKMILGVVKTLSKVVVLIAEIPVALVNSIVGALKEIFTGNFSAVTATFCRPWKKIWADIKEVFSGGEADDSAGSEMLTTTPTELNAQTAAKTTSAMSKLNMKGTSIEGNLRDLDENLTYFSKEMGGMSVRQKLKDMDRLYQQNSRAVEDYHDMIGNIWNMGKDSAEMAAQATAQLLESPTLSQKLMSVFFYYNPQTGQVMSIMPPAYIGKFLDNIRAMMNNPNRNDREAFRQLVMAFDQANEERSHLVNRQGQAITNFMETLARAKKGGWLMDKMFNQLTGDFFQMDKDITTSFSQLAAGKAKTSETKGVTGENHGSNSLLQFAGAGAPAAKSFVVNTSVGQPKKKNQVDKVVLPPRMASNASAPDVDKEAETSRQVQREWEKRENTRKALLDKGASEADLMKRGYGKMSLAEYRAKYDRTGNDPNTSRGLGMRLAKDIQAFQNQGQDVNMQGFKMTAQTPIIRLTTDGLTQNLYMFSPEWQAVNGAANLSDEDVAQLLAKGDADIAEKAKKAYERKQQEKRELEAKRRRQQQILDYSAKVSGGFIEVKIGEDVDAMMAAWKAHMAKRNQLLRDPNLTPQQVEEMGFVYYDWDEWKKYYRRTHGLPEDGIRRIPFEGKKKERKIDWGTRAALTPDELKKYGIEASTEGPVMIPLEKAMAATSDLLNGAKTMYAIRDGLEVMSQGLKTEAGEMKNRREKGIPTAVMEMGGSSSGFSPVPPDQSHYAQVG